jgi:hypothetical protein
VSADVNLKTKEKGKMEEKRCQSCYMPMSKPENFGKEADGSPSEDYCCYCYENGDFTTKQTLEEAVESNIQFWQDEGQTAEEARADIMKVFPTLKRWKTACQVLRAR